MSNNVVEGLIPYSILDRIGNGVLLILKAVVEEGKWGCPFLDLNYNSGWERMKEGDHTSFRIEQRQFYSDWIWNSLIRGDMILFRWQTWLSLWDSWDRFPSNLLLVLLFLYKFRAQQRLSYIFQHLIRTFFYFFPHCFPYKESRRGSYGIKLKMERSLSKNMKGIKTKLCTLLKSFVLSCVVLNEKLAEIIFFSFNNFLNKLSWRLQ